MSVTVNSVGTNTKQLVISGETSISNILTEVGNALTALGWTLYDTVTTGSNNAQVRQIFRVLNADATTYKYLGILWHPIKGLFHTTAYESWNNSTHVGTNEVFTNGYTFPLGVQYSNCSIYIMATARWAVLYSVVRGEYGPWQGVFEFEREAVEDTVGAGFPCFAWTNSNIIGEPVGHSATLGTFNYDSWCMSFPRTPHPYTDINAAAYNNFVSGFGVYPPPAYAGLTSGHANKLGGVGSGYTWDSVKKAVHVLKGGGVTTATPRGRMFGVKAIGPTGDILDTVVLPVDANYHYASSGGTNTDHWILPINGGYHMSYAVGANRLAATGYGTGMGGTDIYDGVLVKGRYIYAGGGTGLWKIDLDSAVCSQVFGTSLVHGVEYDGGAYLYFTTAAGVTRLAVADDSLTNLTAGTGGCSGIAMDETYIYVGHRTASTTPKVDVIDRSTFAVLGTYTSPAISSQSLYSLCVDYTGNVYAISGSWQNDTSSTLYKIVGSTRSGSRSSSVFSGGSFNGCFSAGLYWDGSGINYMGIGFNNNGGNPGYTHMRFSTALAQIFVQTYNLGVVNYTPTPCNHSLTPMKGVAVGCSLAAQSAAIAHPVLAASLMDGVSGYASAIYSFPTIAAGGNITNNVRNFGSFYVSFTNADATPVIVMTGLHSKYNYAGVATAHVLLPA